MKVLLVRRGSIENADGISSYILELAQNLSKRGHDARIMCGHLCQHDYKPLEEIPPVIPGPNSASPIAWAKELSRVIAMFLPDIVHVNNAILLLPLKRIPMIMTYHGLEPMLDNRIRKLQKLFRMYLMASSINYRKIIVSSNKLKYELVRMLPQIRKKIARVPIGLSLTRYRKNARKLSERELAVIHVGTRMQKNLLCSIQALRLVRKKGLKAKLYVTGSDTPYLRHCIRENPDAREFIEYVGFIDKDSFIEILGRSRVFILPSYYEGFSIATLESIACGTPAIVSDAIAEELVRHGVNGFRVKNPNDYRDFAYYIEALLLDDSLWKRMSNACLKSSEPYDVNITVDKICNLYKNCIQK